MSGAIARPAALARARVIALVVVVGGGLLLALSARAGLVTPPDGLKLEGLIVLGVTVTMAALWIFEGMPLAATALLPMALFPLLGVAQGKAVARAYFSSEIMLLMGGFFLARGLEKHGVPQRLASYVARWASGDATKLLFGLMVATAFLSFWVSNTATTLIMITVAMAAVTKARAQAKNDPVVVKRFSFAMALGVAYAANAGGMATPVGTAPNVILLGLYKKLVPAAEPIPFLEWMIITAPIVVVLVPFMAVFLARVALPFPRDLDLGAREPDAAPPPLAPGARRALVIFVATAVLWVWRADVDLGFLRIPGWSTLLGLSAFVDDGVVAIAGCAAMFACPAGGAARERVLTWDTATTIPWYLLLLFGGGLALAESFSSSGLSAWLGDQLVWMRGAPPWLIVLVLCLGMSLLTEVTSNTAVTTLLLPVMFSVATSLELPPLLLMLPTALCASLAFILPIATPPNAIAAGAAAMSPLDMARVGVVLNMIAVVLVTVVTMLWMAPRLGL